MAWFPHSLRRAAVALSLVVTVLPVGGVWAQEATASVDIRNFVFATPELHVAPGTTVTWTNLDQLQHTVTADDGSFDSGFLDPGASFSFTFAQPGRYQYYCQPHGGPGMTGMSAVVVVDDAAATVPATDPASQSSESGHEMGDAYPGGY